MDKGKGKTLPGDLCKGTTFPLMRPYRDKHKFPCDCHDWDKTVILPCPAPGPAPDEPGAAAL